MPMFEIEIITITILTGIICSIVGSIITLQDEYIVTEASSKSALLGMALGFALFIDLSSSFFIPLATIFGILGILLSRYLYNNKIFDNKTGLFIVSSIIFAVGILIIDIFTNLTHADINTVFTGDLAILPFERIVIGDKDYGVIYIYILIIVLIFNIVMTLIFYKKIKLISIDLDYAKSIKFPINKIYIIIIIMIAITVAASFRVTGSLMVIAFILAPPLTAKLYSNRLSIIITTSIMISIIASLISFNLAEKFNILVTGTIASILGLFFIFSAFLAPEKGIFIVLLNKRRNKVNVTVKIATVFIHLNSNNLSLDALHKKIFWSKKYTKKVIKILKSRDLITIENNLIFLTDSGRELAINSLK